MWGFAGSVMWALAGFAVGVVAGVGWWLARRSTGKRRDGVLTFSSIEDIRSIGELSAFKVITKEIVTATDHSFGEVGRRYFEWMITSRKMAMIIAFEIDFRYDLRSQEFGIRREVGGVRFLMPKCFYETRIRDMYFYDEQNSRFLPWLLPDLINRVFGSGFNESDKNRLIEEAKKQATQQAAQLVERMRSDVQQSARQTMELLARGFGVESVKVEFSGAAPEQRAVEYAQGRGDEHGKDVD